MKVPQVRQVYYNIFVESALSNTSEKAKDPKYRGSASLAYFETYCLISKSTNPYLGININTFSNKKTLNRFSKNHAAIWRLFMRSLRRRLAASWTVSVFTEFSHYALDYYHAILHHTVILCYVSIVLH
ncbi:hypothetical protein RIR_jg32254.t2 [Rhizophagus irregularis DAOM 181602=DAOM 197198]|nr:hypothetical protein RIR_jg32254.t2 [Rhizophagus irregularis DAOM 181602=DAOM 197198]